MVIYIHEGLFCETILSMSDTLREEILEGINFREFFSDILR